MTLILVNYQHFVEVTQLVDCLNFVIKILKQNKFQMLSAISNYLPSMKIVNYINFSHNSTKFLNTLYQMKNNVLKLLNK